MVQFEWRECCLPCASMYWTSPGLIPVFVYTSSRSFLCCTLDGAVIGVVVRPSWLHPVDMAAHMLFPSWIAYNTRVQLPMDLVIIRVLVKFIEPFFHDFITIILPVKRELFICASPMACRMLQNTINIMFCVKRNVYAYISVDV